MDAGLDLIGYANALGRAQAAWHFSGAELRRGAALATISAAWDIFRRDAGPGDIGPAHEVTLAATRLLFTEDPRRDSVLLWLADHGVAAIADAASSVSRMVGATRRFGEEEQALLDTARDALMHPAATPGAIGRMITRGLCSDDPVLEPLIRFAATIDRLRDDARFIEAHGTEVSHDFPRGKLSRYIPAEPAGCWALNLSLLTLAGQPPGVPPPPGLVSRILFRRDLQPEAIASNLVEGAATAWSGIYDRLARLDPELSRSRDALAHLSRNARTRDAWLLVAALGACKRTQLARALGLSRAGADIQAHALADARLVTLAAGGQIDLTRPRTRKDAVPKALAQGPLGDAMLDLDANLAEIDRLLARSAR